MSRALLIVSIDFGTTHSGVSWATFNGTKLARELPEHLITDWPRPGHGNPTNEKVPSSISYDDDGQPCSWGYGVTSESNSVTSVSNSLRWIKVLLEENPQFREKINLIRQANQLLKRLKKKPVQVVADYLEFLWGWADKAIRRSIGNYEKKHDVMIYLTVPAVWTQEAKNQTKEAAIMARLPGKIDLISEPEAAALHVFREKQDEEDLELDDFLVICDAGGATVDLISYKVVGTKPLRVEEAATGDGDLCGSVYLDLALERLIMLRVGEDQYRSLSAEVKRKMIDDDFEHIRRLFGSANEENRDKYSVGLKGVKEDPKAGILDETILLERNELRTLFDEVHGKIILLVEDQVQQIKDKHHDRRPKVILVGGFGGNEYLYTQLRNALLPRKVPVFASPSSWSAVCRGGARWGLQAAEDRNRVSSDFSTNSSGEFAGMGLWDDPSNPTTSKTISTIAARIVRHSFGVLVVDMYDKDKHSPIYKVYDPIIKKYVVKQIRWLLKKGQSVRTGDPVSINMRSLRKINLFNFDWNVHATFELCVCDDDTPPDYMNEEVQKLCELKTKLPFYKIWYRLPHAECGALYRGIQLKLGIEVGTANDLHFIMTYQGKRIGDVRPKYRPFV